MNDDKNTLAQDIRQDTRIVHTGGSHQSDTPAPANFETGIADLEGAWRAFAFDSGNSALEAVLQILPKESRILVPESWHAGSWSRHPWGRTLAPIGFDPTSLSEIRFLFERGASAILLESPSDPLLEISDFEAISKLAHEFRRLVIVDNSSLTGYFQKPLAHGADVVLYTSLQAIAGHIPTKAGAIAVRDEKIALNLGAIRAREGSALSPGDAWLLLQGLRTLHLRAERAQNSAQRIAQWLEDHPRVLRVHYPHSPKHRGGSTHLKQSSGGGWIIGFETSVPWLATALVRSLRIWVRSDARDCGESTVSHPYTGSHKDLPEATLRRLRINESLVRLSVGLEDVDDLIRDLDQALRSPLGESGGAPNWVI